MSRVPGRYWFFGAFPVFLQEPHHLGVRTEGRGRVQCLAILSYDLAGHHRALRASSAYS